jgi:hypothetical protein
MIRLVTVVGHGLELLPHFIQHYRNNVDEINIVVYSSDKYPYIEDDIKTIISEYENVKIVHSEKWRVFDWVHVTYLYNKIKNTQPDDWWVIADIDEFQIYSKRIKGIVKECEENGWEFVTGGFIDRIGADGTFPEIYEYTSIWKQFPMAGFFRYPISNACPNKVTLCKGKIEISNGQHYAIIDGQTTWKWQGWNHPLRYPIDKNFTQVHHFKWDSTCKRRLKDVADIQEDYAYSDEYRIMYEHIKNNKFKIDINNKNYFFENLPIFGYEYYRNWKQLTKKIISI